MSAPPPPTRVELIAWCQSNARLVQPPTDAMFAALAAALTQAEAERETLRAALPTRDQLEALLFVGDAFVEGPFCAACHMPNDLDAGRGQLIPKHKPDCWLAALLTPREDR